MQKTYTFDPKIYNVRVKWTGYFMIFLVVQLLIFFLKDTSNYIYLFGVVAAGYGALNTFIFKANPSQVVIDDETISFVSFGEAKYQIDKLTNFQVKEFASSQFYIRVEQQGGKRGRYWVNYYFFDNREELIEEIYYIEKRVHPDSIKFRGREDMFNTRPCYAQRQAEGTDDIDPFFEQ